MAKRISRMATLLGLAIMLPVLAGCTNSFMGDGGWVDSMMQRHVSRLHDRVWAKRAFHLRYGHCNRMHADHFEEGFLAGYCDIYEGGDGQTPTLPPKKYWGFQYQSEEGYEMQQAWYAGFEQGAVSAKGDGSSRYRGIQLSRELEELLAEQRRIQDHHNGIEREYIVDMHEVPSEKDETVIVDLDHPAPQTPLPGALQPMTNRPASIQGPVPLYPASRSIPGGSETPLPLNRIMPAAPPIDGSRETR